MVARRTLPSGYLYSTHTVVDPPGLLARACAVTVMLKLMQHVQLCPSMMYGCAHCHLRRSHSRRVVYVTHKASPFLPPLSLPCPSLSLALYLLKYTLPCMQTCPQMGALTMALIELEIKRTEHRAAEEGIVPAAVAQKALDAASGRVTLQDRCGSVQVCNHCAVRRTWGKHRDRCASVQPLRGAQSAWEASTPQETPPVF